MAVDYVILNKDSSENGIIAINKSVFKSIAEITIDDLDHAERAEKSSFSKAVIVRITDNRLMIETDIHVKYGANINATCEQVQNKIYENILFMTGFKTSEVSVNVTGFEM